MIVFLAYRMKLYWLLSDKYKHKHRTIFYSSVWTYNFIHNGGMTWRHSKHESYLRWGFLAPVKTAENWVWYARKGNKNLEKRTREFPVQVTTTIYWEADIKTVATAYIDDFHASWKTQNDIFNNQFYSQVCEQRPPHPRERQNMVFSDKWSLFGSHFV